MANEGFVHYLNRSDVAKRLGTTVSSVRRMEGRDLHPKLIDGIWNFDPLEVERVAAKRPPKSKVKEQQARSAGTTAAAVFAALERGLDMKQIVMQLEVHPNEVLDLYKDWQENDKTGLLRSRR